MSNTSAALEHPIFGEVISTYTRAQAIADGVLFDISKLATEYGIAFPVAITAGAHAKVIAFDEKKLMGWGQDIEGRTWDVLTMFKNAAKRAAGSEMRFSVFVRCNDRRLREIHLKAICGPGDTAEPVITIMLPDED